MHTTLSCTCTWGSPEVQLIWLQFADVRLPELHSLHQAKIINAFHDGIFVSLPGFEVDGLVHHSQISRQLDMDNTLPKVERFKRIQEIVGDIDYEVWVKIVYVAKTEHLKCECSLKMVRDPSISVLLCRRVVAKSLQTARIMVPLDQLARGLALAAIPC